MIFATLNTSESRDGNIVLVHPAQDIALDLSSRYDSIRVVLERASKEFPSLKNIYKTFVERRASVENLALVDLEDLRSSFQRNGQLLFKSIIPRTWLFADGSSYLEHVKLVRQARKAPLPENLLTDPLIYQAESGFFWDVGARITQHPEQYELDFEGELGVVTDDVPMGVDAVTAIQHIRLVILINDFSLRGLIPSELQKGFGFFQSKPPKALSPFALTLDELEDVFLDGRFQLQFKVTWNDKVFGCLDASLMHFNFGELIAHAARTRPLAAGTIIGSGTVANPFSMGNGHSCIVEKRMVEIIQGGQPLTRFLKSGDRIELEAFKKGETKSLFGEMVHYIS